MRDGERQRERGELGSKERIKARRSTRMAFVQMRMKKTNKQKKTKENLIG